MSASETSGAERRLVRKTFLVGSLTLLSRLAGLARTVLVANYLGTSAAADAFRIAFLLPNLFRRLVGEGAVTSAFVPLLAETCEREGEERGRVFAEAFLCFWAALLVAITVAGVLGCGWAITTLYGAADPRVGLTVELTRIVFWYLLLVGGFAAGHGILTARGYFTASALGPVLFNVGFLVAAFVLSSALPTLAAAVVVSVAVLVGGVIQVAAVAVPVWRLGIRPRIRNPWRHAGVRRVVGLLVPGTLGAGIYQINVVLTTAIAARLEGGAVSALAYSSLVMEFVLGVFVMALNTVGLTTLSQHAARRDSDAFHATVASALRLVLFLTIPSAVGLATLHRPILEMLFLGGLYDATSLDMTARVFFFHALGVPFIGIYRILVSTFHARKDLRTPVLLALPNVALSVGLAYGLSRGSLGFVGIALASTIAAAVHAVVLWFVYTRQKEGSNGVGFAALIWKTATAAAIMGAYCIWARGWLPDAPGKWMQIGSVLLVVAGGVVVFFAIATVLRMPEARWLRNALLKKSGKERRP